MLKVYGCDISKLSDADFMKMYKNLNESRKEEADKMKSPKAKRLSVAAGALLQYGVSKFTDIPFKEWKFSKTENGKPYFENLNLHFNISHTENLVLCAIADKPVGIDAEKIRKVNIDIAKKYFSKRERDYVLNGVINKTERFFEIWTKKEAYVKMLGTGVTDFLSFDALAKKISTKKCGDYIVSITCEKFPDIEFIKNLHSV